MKKIVVLIATHVAALAVGFAVGVYVLPILTAPDAPSVDEVASAYSLHVSRRIRFSGEMWLSRLDDRPQGNSQTIAQG